MQAPEVVYIALGSNRGARELYLSAARTAIADLPGTSVVAASDVEETEPIGPPGQARYLNQMIAIHTSLEPEQLLSELQRIETENGRIRAGRWGSRTLDLDIVRFGSREIRTPRLTVPHPELGRRAFWQRELEQLRDD